MGRRIGHFGLVNYREHPTEKNYTVFNFNSAEEAQMFHGLLSQRKIWFEEATEEDERGRIYLFAVRFSDIDRVQRVNFEVTGKFRKRMIKSPVLRYSLVVLFLGLLVIAVVGYIKNTENSEGTPVESSEK